MPFSGPNGSGGSLHSSTDCQECSDERTLWRRGSHELRRGHERPAWTRRF
jgi:hypothetical protein